ncbi:MAG: hypothetical protein FJ125_08595 [Deltaproteobacteria bacterium]|nr:hypothetical protein [Deltaproteobacteria bacterium]
MRASLPREPSPPSGADLLKEGKDGSELPKGPPSYGKLLLILLSCLLLIPLGVGSGSMFGSCDEETSSSFAVVHGTQIDQQQLLFQLVREQGFAAGSPQDDEASDLRRLLERAVAVHVLAHRAEEEGLEVGEAELAAYLKDAGRNGDFPLLAGEDGRLDGQRYTQVVQYGFRLSVRRYEQYKRAELLARKALERLGPEARGPEVVPGIGAAEAWLFHPLLAARLGAQAPGPGPRVWELVEQDRATGKVKINEARLKAGPEQ